MEQTTDPIATKHGPAPYRVSPCPVDQGIAQALMIPFAMAARHVLQNRPTEMLLAKRHHSLQTLALDRKHKAFREGVQVRTPRRQPQCLHPTLP
jgi:hypothetical protein